LHQSSNQEDIAIKSLRLRETLNQPSSNPFLPGYNQPLGIALLVGLLYA
jgi:hypothetical protein